jgi:hypothetical protein
MVDVDTLVKEHSLIEALPGAEVHCAFLHEEGVDALRQTAAFASCEADLA